VWKADLTWVRGLLVPGSNGLNHKVSIDGRVAVLTIRRVSGGEIGNGTWTGDPCGTGEGGEVPQEGLCQDPGNQLTGGEKAKEDVRKAIAFWMRAARLCGKALRMALGGAQGLFSTMNW
jgi:hypothetical protein